MTTLSWNNELILQAAVAATVLLVVGYVLALLVYKRTITALSQRLVQTGEQYQTELEKRQQTLHQQQLQNAGLQQQLQHAHADEQRLTQALQEGRVQLQQRQQDWQTALQQQHAAEKRLDSNAATLQALQAQIDELRERLKQRGAELSDQRQRNQALMEQVSKEGRRAQALATAEQEVRQQLQEHKALLAEQREIAQQLYAQLAEQQRRYAQLQTEQDEREASHAREVANFEQQKTSLAEHFKVLSNEILEAKSRALQENSKLTLTSVIGPFQQSLDGFKKEVQEIHHRESTQQGELRKELSLLKELNQKITTEAHELSTALRGQKKLQGNWGELVLENVLDRSGLQLGKDYQREVSITTEEGRQRPDALVYLPQGKHLIIDAKVSLNAYTRFVNAEDKLTRSQALKEHVQAVASRIKELADRDYYKLPGLNSPEMVFMFIPIESAFVEALKADETLFQQAIENNVLVATPTTLLTSLNIVRQLWRYEDQNKHTVLLAKKAEAVFKKLNTFLGSFERLKKGLDSANEAYSRAENQLLSGKGNLVKQVGEFKNLAPAIKAELPSYFSEKAALEIDFNHEEVAEPLSQTDKPLAQ